MKRKSSADTLMGRMKRETEKRVALRAGPDVKREGGNSPQSPPPPRRPIALVLSEMRGINDCALVYRSPLATALEYAQDPQGLLLRKYLRLASPTPLWAFQKSAVEFMKRREADSEEVGCRGGLLCDEPGLGKSKDALTVILEENQAMARDTGQRFNGATLLVCSNILIKNWLAELQTFPRDAFEYLILKKRESHQEPLYYSKCCDLVFTTYSTVSAVHRRHQLNPEEEDDPHYRILFQTEWHRLVADEAHIFVVEKTDYAVSMFHLRAQRKWGLSGTPTRNHRTDLVTLLHFIGLSEVRETTNMTQLCEKVLLRRTRESLALSPNPSVEGLPSFKSVSRRIELVEFDSAPERILYYMYAKYALLRKGRRRMKTTVTQMIQLLRQLCISPAIVKKLVLPQGLLTIGGNHPPGDLFPPSTTDSESEEDEEALTLREFMSQWRGKGVRVTHSEGGGEERHFVWDPFGERGQFDLVGEEDDREHYQFLFEQFCLTRGRWHMTEEASSQESMPLEKTHAMVRHLVVRTLRLDMPSVKERAILKYVAETPREDKIIIYSNYVAVLVGLNRWLEETGMRTVLVTGQTNRPEVNDSLLNEFACDSSIKVLLITLKLGSEGLNISEANHVIVVDPWWCPFIMEQAEYRVQREKQRKSIFIVYFAMARTIEVHMLNYTMKKKLLLESILSADSPSEESEVSQLFDYRVEISPLTPGE
jgi:SNF2 family DNA or RNA helicase